MLQAVESVIKKSVGYLESKTENELKSDLYLLAQSTYALALSNSNIKTTFMRWLKEKATIKKSMYSNKLYLLF